MLHDPVTPEIVPEAPLYLRLNGPGLKRTGTAVVAVSRTIDVCVNESVLLKLAVAVKAPPAGRLYNHPSGWPLISILLSIREGNPHRKHIFTVHEGADEVSAIVEGEV